MFVVDALCQGNHSSSVSVCVVLIQTLCPAGSASFGKACAALFRAWLCCGVASCVGIILSEWSVWYSLSTTLHTHAYMLCTVCLIGRWEVGDKARIVRNSPMKICMASWWLRRLKGDGRPVVLLCLLVISR